MLKGWGGEHGQQRDGVALQHCVEYEFQREPGGVVVVVFLIRPDEPSDRYGL